MKKMILTASAAIVLCGQVAAQGAYVNVGGGYGFSAASQKIGSNISTSGTITTYEGVYGSYGKGLSFGAAFGYMFNEHVGAELGLGYLLGGKTEYKTTTSTSTTNYSESGNMVRIIPSLVIAGGKEGMVPYARFGLVIGVGGSAMVEMNTTGSSITVYKEEFSGGLPFGFSGGAGIKYGINDKMFLFAEAGLISMSWAATKSVITEYKVGGVDQLATMKIKDKETEYVDSYTKDSAVSDPDGSPKKELKTPGALSSFGINLGLNINF